MPWNAFRIQKEADREQHRLVLNKSQADLANAPTIDKNDWPDFADRQWQQGVDQFFGVQNVARVSSEQAVPGHLTPRQMIFESSKLADLNEV